MVSENKVNTLNKSINRRLATVDPDTMSSKSFDL